MVDLAKYVSKFQKNISNTIIEGLYKVEVVGLMKVCALAIAKAYSLGGSFTKYGI